MSDVERSGSRESGSYKPSSSCQVYHSADMLKVCCVQNEREGKAG